MNRALAMFLGVTASALVGCAGASPPRAEPAAIATSAEAKPVARVDEPARAQSFLHRAPQAGDHVRVHTHALSRYPRPDGMLEGERYVSDYELVARAVSGDAITEATVLFHTNERTQEDNVDDDYRYAPKLTPLSGKRLRIRAEPLSAVEDAGGATNADVEKLALDVVSDIGMRGALDAAIPDRVLFPGDRIDALGPALVRVMNPRTWHFESGGAVLREMTEGEGVFDVVLNVKTESGSELALKGEAHVRRSDRLATMITLEGTFKKDGPDPIAGKIAYERSVE